MLSELTREQRQDFTKDAHDDARCMFHALGFVRVWITEFRSYRMESLEEALLFLSLEFQATRYLDGALDVHVAPMHAETYDDLGDPDYPGPCFDF